MKMIVEQGPPLCHPVGNGNFLHSAPPCPDNGGCIFFRFCWADVGHFLTQFLGVKQRRPWRMGRNRRRNGPCSGRRPGAPDAPIRILESRMVIGA